MKIEIDVEQFANDIKSGKSIGATKSKGTNRVFKCLYGTYE